MGRTAGATRLAAPAVLGGLLLAAVAAVAAPVLTVEPDTATVGDRITVRFTLPDAETGEITWPTVGPALGDFTVLEVDTLADKRARRQFGGPTLLLTVAAWDTGRASTGPLALTVDGRRLQSDGAAVTIRTVLSDSAGQQLRPLKQQEELPITLRDVLAWTWPWILGLALAALAFRALRRWLAARRRGEEGEEEEPPVPPYDEAVAALARLKLDNPLARGDTKGYVSTLTTIVKRLLERVHGDPVLEMTTFELRRWAKRSELRCETKRLLALVETADQVKFARGQLAPGDDEGLYGDAEAIVAAYRPRPDEEEPAGGDPPEGGSGAARGGEADRRRAGTVPRVGRKRSGESSQVESAETADSKDHPRDDQEEPPPPDRLADPAVGEPRRDPPRWRSNVDRNEGDERGSSGRGRGGRR